MGKDKVGTVLAPTKVDSVPANAQWLGGTGAGTWFSLFETEKLNVFKIQRHNPNGNIEIDDLFFLKEKGFSINKDYQFTYVSNAIRCFVFQGGKKYEFLNLKKFEK